MKSHAAPVEKIELDDAFAEERIQIQKRRDWARARFPGLPPMQDVSPLDVRFVLDGGHEHAGDAGQDDRADSEDGQVRIALEQRGLDLVGLALSGGGIRSAAFALGVLQALARVGVFRRLDYLSTVSGGGYMGAALSATAYASYGAFAFDNVEEAEVSAAQPREIQDSPTVRHIRNYSNFLAPRGLLDWLDSFALLARGIVTNMFVIAPWGLVAAAATLAYNPTSASLNVLGPQIPGALALGPHVDAAASWLTKLAGRMAWPAVGTVLLALWFLAWSNRRSTREGELSSEFKGRAARLGGFGLIVLAALVLLSLQNALLAHLVGPASTAPAAHDAPKFLALVKSAFLASPLVVFLVSTFGDRLVKLAKAEATRLSETLAKQASRLALLAGSAALPVLLWLVYLRMVYWGLQCSARPGDCLTWLGTRQLFGYALMPDYTAAAVLVAIAGVLWLATAWLTPNAYSLHRLYRDRLERAFIVHPERGDPKSPGDRRMLHRLRISGLVRRSKAEREERFVHGPFPLMNTALNVQASAQVNRRGRNADFFVFTPLHAGSPATGYVTAAAIEEADHNLNLAAITAISGAAANSNMGADTIRPLSTTLALLNVRLGYWLPNPKKLIEGTYRNSRGMYLGKEMTSSLDENTDRVLLTDGGHIENLGVYELLRRRCKVIVVADAEADPGMHFPSFVALQRYARIDLGIRIDLPWQSIADATRAVMDANAAKREMPPAQKGPHAAFGLIHYDDGSEGYLLYLKSSLTGGENDYIRDYGRLNPSFPHETTADQFFSEEQFEAYRALGFHVTYDALAGRAQIVMPGGVPQSISGPFGKHAAAQTAPIAEFTAILGI